MKGDLLHEFAVSHRGTQLLFTLSNRFCAAVFVVFLVVSGCSGGSQNAASVNIDDMYIAPAGQSVTIVCGAEADGENVIYQWYESSDTSTSGGTAIDGATDRSFGTPVFTEKGIRFYYCTAASEKNGDVSTSKIATVAYTGLPTVYIDTPDNIEITSKNDWIKNAEISVAGAKDESWNSGKVETSIRGRGNSTWEKPKKPYAVKLKKAQKVMGMSSHKRWVLLANYMDGSFMRNETAFYLSRTFEMEWTASGEFADLVLNGRYQGLYWFGESVKVDKNRIDIDDGHENMTDGEDKDYLIEMDTYFDETLRFRSAVKYLPYMIKNDGRMVDESDRITSGGKARLDRLQKKINDLEELLYSGQPDESYAEIIDIDSWVKFWLVNEIMDNKELSRPKSAFFTFDSANNVLKAGPVWDFDWTFSYWLQCQLQDAIYYDALFKSPAFISGIRDVWKKYRDRIDIETTLESMRNKISVAAEYDAMLWGSHTDSGNPGIIGEGDFDSGNPGIIREGDFDSSVNMLKEKLLKKISVVNLFVNNL